MEAERTQRVDVAAAAAAAQKRSAASDETMKIPKLDPAYKPESTQRIAPADDGQTTQKLEDSIQKLQQAKRLLQDK